MAISIPGNSGLQYWGIPVCNFEDSYFALNMRKRFFRTFVRRPNLKERGKEDGQGRNQYEKFPKI